MAGGTAGGGMITDSPRDVAMYTLFSDTSLPICVSPSYFQAEVNP
jgi:hypothetical protein